MTKPCHEFQTNVLTSTTLNFINSDLYLTDDTICVSAYDCFTDIFSRTKHMLVHVYGVLHTHGD